LGPSQAIMPYRRLVHLHDIVARPANSLRAHRRRLTRGGLARIICRSTIGSPAAAGMEKCRPSSGRHPQSHTTTPAAGGWSQKRKPRVPDRFAGGTTWLWTKTIPLGRAPPVRRLTSVIFTLLGRGGSEEYVVTRSIALGSPGGGPR
jgi:hypothetical protein